MIVRTCVFLLLSATLLAQDLPFGPAAEPRSARRRTSRSSASRTRIGSRRTGSPTRAASPSQRHSLLTTIRPGERARPGAEVGVSVALAGTASGHPAGRGRDDVHDPESQRRDRVECRDGKADLGVLVHAGSGGQELLWTAVSRSGDRRRHDLSRVVRCADHRHRRAGPDASCGRPSRPAIPSRATRSRTRRSW